MCVLCVCQQGCSPSNLKTLICLLIAIIQPAGRVEERGVVWRECLKVMASSPPQSAEFSCASGGFPVLKVRNSAVLFVLNIFFTKIRKSTSACLSDGSKANQSIAFSLIESDSLIRIPLSQHAS